MKLVLKRQEQYEPCRHASPGKCRARTTPDTGALFHTYPMWYVHDNDGEIPDTPLYFSAAEARTERDHIASQRT